MKTCTKCGKKAPLEGFNKEKKAKDGRTSQCKTCCNERTRKHYRDNPDAGWSRDIKKKYGITPQDYHDLLAEQGGVCANAGCTATNPGPNKNRWCVDHNHDTGEIRGLLCSNCNAAAGILQDHPDTLRGLADYLEAKGY